MLEAKWPKPSKNYFLIFFAMSHLNPEFAVAIYCGLLRIATKPTAKSGLISSICDPKPFYVAYLSKFFRLVLVWLEEWDNKKYSHMLIPAI